MDDNPLDPYNRMVNPMNGWKYGFPAPLRVDYRKQLREAGYPESDIEMAVAFSRYWTLDF